MKKRPAEMLRVLQVSVPMPEVKLFLEFCEQHHAKASYVGHDLLHCNGVVEVVNRVKDLRHA